jgi:hypothetical protein
MDVPVDLDAAIARHTTGAFDDTTPLPAAGLESLSLLRLAVEVAASDDAEIDATALVELRTVGDLKLWLAELAAGDAAATGAARTGDSR